MPLSQEQLDAVFESFPEAKGVEARKGNAGSRKDEVSWERDNPPPINGPQDFPNLPPPDDTKQSGDGPEPPRGPQAKPVLTLAEWLERDLPPADPILGHWLTTTSRALLTAPTGQGKTMLGISIGFASAAGAGFLHWRGTRPARVLFIDGEMSSRLLKLRLADEANRTGIRPEGMHAFSHEDVENFAPLNTPQGQACINAQIERIGKLDLAIFDNVMSLVAGDQKDEEGWRQTLPWVRSLTKRKIGQLWLHHTGHDESRSYGTKTREWQMDTVIHLEPVERPDTDVSFQLSFRKARERTPATRADFADVTIALVDDQWVGSAAASTARLKLKPLEAKFLDALRDAAIGNDANKMFGCPTAALKIWQTECVKHGLIDPEAKPASSRALFSRHKLELIKANHIACNEAMAWILP